MRQSSTPEPFPTVQENCPVPWAGLGGRLGIGARRLVKIVDAAGCGCWWWARVEKGLGKSKERVER